MNSPNGSNLFWYALLLYFLFMGIAGKLETEDMKLAKARCITDMECVMMYGFDDHDPENFE